MLYNLFEKEGNIGLRHFSWGRGQHQPTQKQVIQHCQLNRVSEKL